jgi:pyrroloquinoline quinone (PQQ) biosynthesis protein C
MRDGTIGASQQRSMFVGFWPLVERFPHFLALNLLKTSHGESGAVDAARSWLAANLSVEQRHAEWFLDWAEAAGVTRRAMLEGPRPASMTAVADWCWQVCAAGELADAMAATNYAIEGATGEWTRTLARSDAYRTRFAAGDAERGLRWLDTHADYDDTHPLQALDIIARLLGPEPSAARVRGVEEAVLKSYELYHLALEVALGSAEADRL